jgi:EAL domain-containing protein (putative c-di-GMP-specific phosphodiesterase class I)
MHAGYRSLIGAEALMRWHREGKQVVTPDRFIPIAERHQVIKPMTWWAIKSTVSRLALWPEELSLAVNITPTLLLDDEILTVVKDSLEIHAVKASRLILEVTESIMVDNQDLMLGKLACLRSLGVKIAIDDFGTGFSSLTYFRDLPADEIKIDRGFVTPMLHSKKDHAIVKAVIDLAHNFSLRVVAEGVEDENTASRLADMRCDVLQGYAFDRPLPLADFEKRYLG